jgi:hypothetical protein
MTDKIDDGWMEDFLVQALETHLDSLADEGVDKLESISWKTYEEAGMLTSDKGLVITVDGVEFQVTIVRSR